VPADVTYVVSWSEVDAEGGEATGVSFVSLVDPVISAALAHEVSAGEASDHVVAATRSRLVDRMSRVMGSLCNRDRRCVCTRRAREIGTWDLSPLSAQRAREPGALILREPWSVHDAGHRAMCSGTATERTSLESEERDGDEADCEQDRDQQGDVSDDAKLVFVSSEAVSDLPGPTHEILHPSPSRPRPGAWGGGERVAHPRGRRATLG
jgi:hypothetical protein